MLGRFPVVLFAVAVALLVRPAPAFGFDKIHGAHGAHPKANYDSLFAAATPLERSEAGRAAIAACLEAYGGREHLKTLRSYRLRWRMLPMMAQDSIDVVKAYSADRRARSTRETSRGPVTTGLSGARAWYQDRDTSFVTSDSGQYRGELYAYLTLALPFVLETGPFREVRYGLRTGDSLAYLYCRVSDSLTVVVGIDPRDHRVRSSEGVVRQGAQKLVFVNRFSDFRQRHGYWFPHQLVNVSMGLEVGRSSLAEVEVNLPEKELGLEPEEPTKPRRRL